jgi:hypothetical protein
MCARQGKFKWIRPAWILSFVCDYTERDGIQLRIGAHATFLV